MISADALELESQRHNQKLYVSFKRTTQEIKGNCQINLLAPVFNELF